MSGSFSLYVHWPFCSTKCPYCDFNSHAASWNEARWRTALTQEVEYYGEKTKQNQLDAIFFGGGTPSLMAPETTAALIETARRFWKFSKNIEVTLEANPATVEVGRFRDFFDANVNRLSLGVQSFDDKALAFLGRGHSASEARAAIELGKKIFPRISFDLIYGLPGQTSKEWRDRLCQAVQLAGGHLSAYLLTIEPGTQFARQRVPEAGEEAGAALYEITRDVLIDAGLPAYEVSNHARPGMECRYNLGVWRGEDYVGVGPGAHGRLSSLRGTEATRQIRDPNRWLAAVKEKGHGTAAQILLSPQERLEEQVLLGLRLTEGLPKAVARRLDQAKVKTLVKERLLVLKQGRLSTTPAGRLCLDALLANLLA